MAKKAVNRRSTPELDLGAPTTPPKQKKAAERTETPETDVQPIAPAPSPADYIARTYGIEPNCTNVPRLLYAILCEVVRGK